MMNRVTVIDRRSSGRKRIVIRPRSRATALNQSDSCNVIDWTIGDAFLAWRQARRPRADYTARRATRRITLECPSALLVRPVLNMRTGGRILVDNLLLQGVELAFCVPGESYLPVLDALYDVRDRLRLIVCRQEGGAAYMAEAYGKLTGRPGIVFVTRGPGASNAAIGIHTAAQDSTPMIVFVGQIGADVVDREAFQEIDYRRMFGSIAKWVAQIDRAERVPEYVARAFRNQDVFDNRHANYAGDVGIGINPRLAARVRDANVLLVIGERLGEMVTGGYALLEAPQPKQALIHVHPGADELGRVY